MLIFTYVKYICSVVIQALHSVASRSAVAKSFIDGIVGKGRQCTGAAADV